MSESTATLLGGRVATRHRPFTIVDPRDPHFIGILAAFRTVGGLLTLQDAASRWPLWTEQTLKLSMEGAGLVSFEWRHVCWLPVFQFQPGGGSQREGLQHTLWELRAMGLESWDRALWFAQPHRLLGGRTPSAVLAADPEGVLRAARVDRFFGCD